MTRFKPELVKDSATAEKALDKSLAARRAIKARKARADKVLQEREYVRHEIQAYQHVQDLETMAVMLLSGTELHYDETTHQTVPVPLDKERTAQLAACANIKFGLLKKVLPDIKLQELSGPGGAELGEKRVLATMELRNRLREALQGLNGEKQGDEIPDFMQ